MEKDIAIWACDFTYVVHLTYLTTANNGSIVDEKLL